MIDASSADGAVQLSGDQLAVAATQYPTYLIAWLEDGEPVMARTFSTMEPGRAAKVMAGVGNPFYAFDEATIGFDWWQGIAVDDWSEAAIASADIATNNASIAAQLSSPSSKVHAP